MTDAELDELLGDMDGIRLMAVGPDGIAECIQLDRHSLKTAVATRAVLRRHLGHVTTIPLYTQDEHDAFVTALIRGELVWRLWESE